jgi:hypothetical protein
MNLIPKDFIVEDQREYRVKIGRVKASSLSGFLAGAITASIIWIAGLAINNLYIAL